MAFPTIANADTTFGTVTGNSDSWTLTYPTNIAAGDLLVAFVSTDGNTNPSFPAGWISFTVALGKPQTSTVAKFLANGTETGTFTLSLGAAEQGAWRIFRIPAASWEGTIGTLMLGSTAGACQATGADGISDSPNSGNLNPFNWDVEDTLWIAMMGCDTSRSISAYPLPDRQTADISGGANGATLGICTVESAVASLTPGAFTISTSDDWEAILVAIRPAAVVAAERVPRSTPYPQLLAH